MSRKSLIVFIIILILIGIFVILYFNFKSSKTSTSSVRINIPKKVVKDITNYFEEVDNVSFFEPYVLNISFVDLRSGKYPLVDDIEFLGYYFENDKKVVYVRENGQIYKYDIDDLLKKRYYILNVSSSQLIVLDTDEGTIKIILSKGIGGM
ncbi:MAG: hypothetical protein H0Z24_00740 [Thermosipho sp. (in: Bacteria)]|nr:hypothetical protein [Thermosipho sp. (in: thermotogales)]